MSLLKYTHELEFPTSWTECEMVFKYPLENNRIFMINENWEYLIFDTLRGQIAIDNSKALHGKLEGETVEAWKINSHSPYSYWFTFTNSHTMIYYSHTHKMLKEWSFMTGKETGNWNVPLTLSDDAKYMTFLKYFPESKNLQVLHMVD
jgi:hypothetical protein